MKIKTILTALIFSFFVLTVIAQTPSFSWAKKTFITGVINGVATGPHTGDQTDMTIDNNGNIYVTSPSAGSVNIMNTNFHVTTYGYESIIVKTNASGNLLWSRQVGTENGALAVQKNTEDLFFAGPFGGTLTLGTNTFVTAPNDYDICVVKYDINGNVVWADKAISTSFDMLRSNCMGADSVGNSYFSGTFGNSTIAFQSQTLSPGANSNVFLAKYNSSGTAVWAKLIGGSGCNTFVSAVHTDKAGNTYVSGRFENAPLIIGTYTFNNVAVWPIRDLFIVKYDNAGNVIWAKQGIYNGTGCGGYGNGVTNMTSSGTDLYITGTCNDIDLGAPNTHTSPNCDMYMAKLDLTGNVTLFKLATGTGIETGRDVQVDAVGNIYVAGHSGSGGTASFGTLTVNYPGNSYQLYIVKYNSSGVEQWIKTTTPINGGSISEAMATLPNGDCFLTAGIVYGVSFDNISLSTYSFPTDLILARLGNTPIPPPPPVNIEDVMGNQTNSKMYPNPVKGSFIIEVNENIKLMLCDVFGKIIINKELTEGKSEINLSSFANGVYLVKTITKNRVNTIKIIKED